MRKHFKSLVNNRFSHSLKPQKMICNLKKPNNLPETCQSQMSKKSLTFFQSTLSPISSWICLMKEKEIDVLVGEKDVCSCYSSNLSNIHSSGGKTP